MDKVKSTLKQVVRDWSREGEGERVSCYQPVIDTIRRLFPSTQWSVCEALIAKLLLYMMNVVSARPVLKPIIVFSRPCRVRTSGF